eukprot:m.241809 g.241809  ORF g.241809 m.241809 type:complete len:185 (-) comp27049_c0_seq1:329-883(-)
MDVRIFSRVTAFYLIGMYFAKGNGYYAKFLPPLLEKRIRSVGVTVSITVVLVLFSMVNLWLLLIHDKASGALLAAEVLRRVDMVCALLVCLFTYNRRQNRQHVHLFSNRAYILTLLLAASQLTIFFSNLDVFVRLNSPGLLHTRLPVMEKWAVGLYPFTLLARLSVGLLLGRMCVGIREAHSDH